MEPVTEPQDQRRSINFGLRVEICRPHSATQLFEYLAPPTYSCCLPTLWGGGLAAQRRGRWGDWLWKSGRDWRFPDPNLHRQARQRRLDQEPRLSVPPHLSIQVQERVEDRGQPARSRRIVASQSRHQPVPTPLHQPPHHLPQLRPRGVNAVELLQGLRRPPFEHAIVVKALSDKRGPAAAAATLYEETGESRARRALIAAEMKSQPQPRFKGRPTKKTRRDYERWLRSGDDE